LIHQVIEIAQNVGSFVHEVQVRFAVDTPKGGIRQSQDIHVPNCGRWHDLTKSQLDGLGRTEMTCSNRCRQHQDSWPHRWRPLEKVQMNTEFTQIS
jgi:hypothetical protein